MKTTNYIEFNQTIYNYSLKKYLPRGSNSGKVNLIILIFGIIILFNTPIPGQNKSKITSKENSESILQKVAKIQANGDDVKFKDEDSNTILKVIDEGNFGTIQIKNGIPSNTDRKIYNNNGVLHFNGNSLGSGNSLNDLVDAKYDGESLFVGDSSGINDDAGASDGLKNYNTALGKAALPSNTSGKRNTAVGRHALYSNTTGDNNTAAGHNSLYANSTGYNNSAIGTGALFNNSTGYNNTASGFQSLYSNTIGFNNTSSGYHALYSNTTGNSNSAFGSEALKENTTGIQNTAVGAYSLQLNTIGSENTAVGNEALQNNTSGYNNTAIGASALKFNTTATNNTAIGRNSLYSNVSGVSNTAIGRSALYRNTSGEGNSIMGSSAQYNDSTGSYNTVIGNTALYNNMDGYNNVVIGYAAEYENLNGSNNTIIGAEAGHGDPWQTISRSGNIFLGYQAGYRETGSDKLYINNDSSSAPLIWGDFATDNVTINGNLHVEGNITYNSILLSNAWVLNGNDIYSSNSGKVGIGTSTPNAGLHVNKDSGVLFEGNYGLGSIPTEGGGTRMMWYPKKAAFRAGSAIDHWDDTNIGDYSVALNYQTTASGFYSFASGYLTEASGVASTAMGSNTIAGGLNSTALGSNTEALGDYSTAIGRYVKIGSATNGTIFFGDNSVASSQTSTESNRFVARYSNGYRFFTNAALSSGALMNSGDNAWSSVSDSTKKENFKSVNGEEVLNKISKFKLTSWNYKNQDPKSHRHYGPMAQEFYSAFGNDGIGTIGTDTTINSADFDGINLIAIQALEKRTVEQNEWILKERKKIAKSEIIISELINENNELKKRNHELNKVLSEKIYLEQEINQLTLIIQKYIKEYDDIELTSK